MEYDTHVFKTIAAAAVAAGNYSTVALDKTNAYEYFLKGMEHLGNHNIPDQGRVAICSYRFANLLKMDPAFMKYGDKSQQMLEKGIIGEVDGCKIMKVPATRLPKGCAFILTHPIACTAPEQLAEYKIHDNPPGISGWLVEGRIIMDAFVLNEKRNAVYYHGSQAILGVLDVRTAATDANKTTIMVNGTADTGNVFRYKLGTAGESLNYDDICSTTASGSGANTSYGWTALSTNPMEITPASGNTVVTVAEVNSTDGKVKAVGTAILNIG